MTRRDLCAINLFCILEKIKGKKKIARRERERREKGLPERKNVKGLKMDGNPRIRVVSKIREREGCQ